MPALCKVVKSCAELCVEGQITGSGQKPRRGRSVTLKTRLSEERIRTIFVSMLFFSLQLNVSDPLLPVFLVTKQKCSALVQTSESGLQMSASC